MIDKAKLKELATSKLWPFYGLKYFLLHPSLWIGSIIMSFFLVFAMALVFSLVLYFTWPSTGHGWWTYTYSLLRSIGYASGGVLITFIISIPIMIALALDRMVRKVYLMEQLELKSEGFFYSAYSTTITMFRTIGWRLFWPIFGIFASFFLGPIGVFIAQVGIGHLAAIDGCDLALSIQGVGTKERIQAYKNHSKEIFLGGVIGGCLSLMLSFTLIGWLIWVPAMFVGAALWTTSWKESPVYIP